MTRRVVQLVCTDINRRTGEGTHAPWRLGRFEIDEGYTGQVIHAESGSYSSDVTANQPIRLRYAREREEAARGTALADFERSCARCPRNYRLSAERMLAVVTALLAVDDSPVVTVDISGLLWHKLSR